MMRKKTILFLVFAMVLTMSFGVFTSAPVSAETANPIQVKVGIYDYTAAAQKVEGASATGVVVPELTVTTESGSTALDVVKAVLKEKNIPYVVDGGYFYVKSIGTLADSSKDYPASGWLFSINDSFGNNGANDTVVKAGDRLEWHYSLIGYGTDVGNYWDEVPSLTQFSVGGSKVTLSTESTVDATYKKTTTYFIDDGSGKVKMEGTGTKEDPFVIKMNTYANTRLTSLKASIKTILDPHYYTLDTDVTQKTDFSKAVVFSLNTKGNILKTYYKVEVKSTLKPMIDVATMKDVAPTDWYYDDVSFILAKGVMKGISETSFAAESNMTRGQFVTVLGRYAGILDSSTENAKATKFIDVDAKYYYASHIAWAEEKGIINGISDNRFAPDENITREQMAKIIYGYAKVISISLASGDPQPFADDAAISQWAKTPVYAMKSAGILNGKGNNIFDPQGKATRGEVSKVIAALMLLK